MTRTARAALQTRNRGGQFATVTTVEAAVINGVSSQDGTDRSWEAAQATLERRSRHRKDRRPRDLTTLDGILREQAKVYVRHDRKNGISDSRAESKSRQLKRMVETLDVVEEVRLRQEVLERLAAVEAALGCNVPQRVQLPIELLEPAPEDGSSDGAEEAA